jgi:hypothetical protein
MLLVTDATHFLKYVTEVFMTQFGHGKDQHALIQYACMQCNGANLTQYLKHVPGAQFNTSNSQLLNQVLSSLHAVPLSMSACMINLFYKITHLYKSRRI